MKLEERVLTDSNEVHDRRLKACYAFSARHFESLLHSACSHFADCVETPFNFIKASRMRNPVPKNLPVLFEKFLELAVKLNLKCSALEIIGSALCLDSYPPEMHCK
jgi:hypothetical protein